MIFSRKQNQTEEELLRAFTQGDSSAFDGLYNRYAPMLLNFVKGMIKDIARAEDIVQNIFMRLLLNAPKFESISSLKNWLYVCARNEVISVLRSKWEKSVEKVDFISEHLPSVAETPHAEMMAELEDEHRRSAAIRAALAEMPEKRAKVFKLSKLEHVPNNEIARQMGISERTVEKHIQLAFQDLRKDIS